MTGLSQRFAIAAIVLMLSSAVPVWFHTLEQPTYDDCRDPDSFFRGSRIGGATMRKPVPRRRTSISVEGRMYTKAENPLAVLVFRSYQSSRFYASPMSFGFDSMSYIIPREVRWLEVGGDRLPVHWIQYEAEGEVRVEAYLYIQGGVAITHPLQSGPDLALAQLKDGTSPLTVMIAAASGSVAGESELKAATESWFIEAWKEMKVACES